ncbi:MAG: hypothetical protein HOV96_31665 [Nonomuraea sp.]|nr:hypothetical protein [Nonomuraea sp.]NUP66525.1 hypothetical protein [Nonomuraea sp.]NUP82106.1 hypothetical protein [Nonomuraea sp.]NUT12520.1 hypothetical protein [Nonomuraea sp.]
MTATEQRTAAPRRTRGRAARRGGRGSVVLHTLVGLVLAAGAVGIQSLELSGDDMGQPLTYVGAKGEDVDAGRFSVRVQNVSSVKAVRVSDKNIPAEQFFLVLEVAATVPKEPVHLGAPTLLTTDGKSFVASDKVDRMKTLAYPWIQPGWWTTGKFVFEVPASALPGARAVFGLPVAGLYSEPLPPEAQVDLGIDDKTAKQLSSAPAEVLNLDEKK